MHPTHRATHSALVAALHLSIWHRQGICCVQTQPGPGRDGCAHATPAPKSPSAAQAGGCGSPASLTRGSLSLSSDSSRPYARASDSRSAFASSPLAVLSLGLVLSLTLGTGVLGAATHIRLTGVRVGPRLPECTCRAGLLGPPAKPPCPLQGAHPASADRRVCTPGTG